MLFLQFLNVSELTIQLGKVGWIFSCLARALWLIGDRFSALLGIGFHSTISELPVLLRLLVEPLRGTLGEGMRPDLHEVLPCPLSSDELHYARGRAHRPR